MASAAARSELLAIIVLFVLFSNYKHTEGKMTVRRPKPGKSVGDQTGQREDANKRLLRPKRARRLLKIEAVQVDEERKGKGREREEE